MASFLKAYVKVKSAVAPNDDTYLSHICVRDGMMFATDSRMTAAAEVEFDGTFLAPAQEFYKAMTILGETDSKLTIKDQDSIVISKSRRRVTISTLDPEDFQYNLPDGDVIMIPDGFVEALKKVAPFMSDDRTKAWANSVRVKGNNVYATNNITLASSTFSNWDRDVDITLPDWVVKYIISRDVKLLAMSYKENSVSFNWEDNSWVRSLRLTEEMPDVVLALMDKIGDVEFAITPEWKDAFTTVAMMSDDIVRICDDRIKAGKGKALIECEVSSPVAEETLWHPRYMELVVNACTHFDPGDWPKPCSWKGENIKGLIVGRRT